jgi:hypothetical protein
LIGGTTLLVIVLRFETGVIGLFPSTADLSIGLPCPPILV